MTIRELVPADREAVRTMLVDCRAFSDVEVQVALDMVDDGLKGDYTLLAVETEGKLRAYACLGHARTTASAWYLYWICVDRSVQGSGVGRLLQASVEDAVRKFGGDRLVVEASGRPDNARVARFYRQAGYAQVGCIPDFYKPGDDCIVYCKILARDSQ
jgi:ribosomal protein S18 acetylase RimI-like enzyme